jgi:hypothetical protein
MTNAAQNILCGVTFSLYIRGSPHQARERVCCAAWGGFFCRPEHGLLAVLCFTKNAHD